MNTFFHAIVAIAVSVAVGGGQLRVRELVHDPKITEVGTTLAPIPSGTPYSCWAVNGSNYVIAYTNTGGGDPFDIVADIYYRNPQRSRLLKLISVPVFMEVENVKLVKITGDSTSQLAFFRTSNLQDWLTIVALDGQSAHRLFNYGTTSIKLTDDKRPKILAYSNSSGTTEVFKWCRAQRKLVHEDRCREK